MVVFRERDYRNIRSLTLIVGGEFLLQLFLRRLLRGGLRGRFVGSRRGFRRSQTFPSVMPAESRLYFRGSRFFLLLVVVLLVFLLLVRLLCRCLLCL